MQYVIGRRADGPVEFEAECSFAIISSLWHSLCLFQSDAPNGLLVKVVTPLAAAVAAAASDAACIAGPPCIFRSLAALFNNAKGCMHAQVICLQALFESAASTGIFSAVSDFYGGPNKLCDAWGGSIDIKRSLQLLAVYSRHGHCCCPQDALPACSHRSPVLPRLIPGRSQGCARVLAAVR